VRFLLRWSRPVPCGGPAVVVTLPSRPSTDDGAPAAWCHRGEHQTSPPACRDPGLLASSNRRCRRRGSPQQRPARRRRLPAPVILVARPRSGPRQQPRPVDGRERTVHRRGCRPGLGFGLTHLGAVPCPRARPRRPRRRRAPGCDRVGLRHRLPVRPACPAGRPAGRHGPQPGAVAYRGTLPAAVRLVFPLVEANAEDVPLADGTFDLVVSEYAASVWCDPNRPNLGVMSRGCGPSGR
jgi:hypothetical protein